MLLHRMNDASPSPLRDAEQSKRNLLFQLLPEYVCTKQASILRSDLTIYLHELSAERKNLQLHLAPLVILYYCCFLLVFSSVS